VLGSFIRSFEVLSDLATRTETQVFEAYLERYWNEVSYNYILIIVVLL